MIKQKPKGRSRDISDDRWPTKDPSEIWVADEAGEGQAESVGDALGEEVQGGDETSHVDGGARVGDAVGGDVDEEFGETADGVGDGDEPDAEGGEEG